MHYHVQLLLPMLMRILQKAVRSTELVHAAKLVSVGWQAGLSAPRVRGLRTTFPRSAHGPALGRGLSWVLPGVNGWEDNRNLDLAAIKVELWAFNG